MQKFSMMKRILALLGHQHWLRFGVRDRAIRWFHDPDTAVDETFEVPFYGCTYSGNFSTFIDWSVYYFGAYAKEELTCMSEFLSGLDDPVVVDVGANVGQHSLFASTIASHVHAFEPFPPVGEKLKEKIARNQLRNVTVHECGLGESDRLLAFRPPTTSNTGTGSFCDPQDGSESIELQVVAADRYFPEAGIDRIDYLKIDVEGFETSVLKGMEQTMRRSRPVCFFEWTQGERGGEDRDGVALFPERYRFFRFVKNEPFLVFFKLRQYRLARIEGAWPDGNLVAVPEEYLQRIAAVQPQPAIARRLGRG